MTLGQMTNEEGTPVMDIADADFEAAQQDFIKSKGVPGKWKTTVSVTMIRDELGNESIETENNSSQTRSEPRKYRRKLVLDHNQLTLGMSLKSVAGGRG